MSAVLAPLYRGPFAYQDRTIIDNRIPARCESPSTSEFTRFPLMLRASEAAADHDADPGFRRLRLNTLQEPRIFITTA